MKKVFVVALAAVCIVGAGLFFLFRGKDGITVKVFSVGKGDITSTLSATGKVVSREESGISASVAGQVNAVYVEEGARASGGALLALLDDRELGEKVQGAEQTVREADEKVRQLNRDFEALSAIYAAGGASRQSVNDAKSALEMARAAAKRATAELNASRIALDKLKIRAPFDGIICRRSINPGEWAAPGVVLFSMAKESPREIEVMVDESDGGLVKAGQAVELTSDAFPGYVWIEQVKEVAPAVRKEGAANSIKVRVDYGPQAPDLKLGQQVDAKIRTAHSSDVIKLPFDAVISSGGKTFVAMVKEGAIRFAPVVTGIEDAASVEIVQGASAGDEVVAPEGKALKEGERVKSVIKETSRQ